MSSGGELRNLSVGAYSTEFYLEKLNSLDYLIKGVQLKRFQFDVLRDLIIFRYGLDYKNESKYSLGVDTIKLEWFITCLLFFRGEDD